MIFSLISSNSVKSVVNRKETEQETKQQFVISAAA